MQLAGSQAKAAVRSAAPRTLSGAPSWGRVLATTVSLWLGRRVARLRHPRLALFDNEFEVETGVFQLIRDTAVWQHIE